MNIFNLLSSSTVTNSSVLVNLPVVGSIQLNWIGNLIRLLIEGVGITALGIFLFTLILKTFVLPLDVYSRYSSKKQALAMEKMRPQMEKLQKQYANDKNMYSMKVQELYKKNGYSMLGACLPMLVSLIIFIVVFNQFSAYSSYANLELYRGMVKAYNDSSVQFIQFDEGLTDLNKQEKFIMYDANGNKINGNVYVDENGTIVCGENGFLVAYYDDFSDSNGEAKIYIDSYTDYLQCVQDKIAIQYAVDIEKFESFYTDMYHGTLANLTYTDNKGQTNEVTYTYNEVKDLAGDLHDRICALMVGDFIKAPAKINSANFFRQNKAGFIWVGNLWYPDSMLEKECPTFDKLVSQMRSYKTKTVEGTPITVANWLKTNGGAETYNDVTAGLSKEKSTFNGYFVLIVVAIGFMLLQQWITMRSQRSLSDLGTVDGRGNSTNKMMMIMMPLMYGIFSFFYSASFSIYMITNTVYSLIETVIINKIMDVKFAKDEAQAEIDRYKRKVYVNNTNKK